MANERARPAYGNDSRRITGSESGLVEALFADPHPYAADRCTIYVDNVMFPQHPLADLQVHGCATPAQQRMRK